MSTWLLRLHVHDERILHALVTRRWRMGDLFMYGVTRLGDAATSIGLTVLLCLGWPPTVRATGVFAAIALVTSHLGVQLLKRTINRPRPRLPVGCASLIHAPDRFSFPSGHAAASLSVAIAIATAVPMAAAGPVLCLAGLVGVSRCYLGVHYPGDVVAGWILAVTGAGVAALVV